VLGLAISHRGEFVVTSSADGTAKRWNAARGEPLLYAAKLVDESKQAWFARVSPDGKVLATGGDDRMLRLRDAVPGRFQTLPGDYACVFSTAINKEGTILATGHIDGVIRLWDLKTRTQIRKLEGHAHRVWSLAFSPDGTRLVSGGGNWDDAVPGEIRIWDTATWKALHEFAAHDDLVFAVAIAPDNKTFATGSRDQSIRTWNIATGKELKTMRQSGSVRTLAYALDGKRLYSCPTGARLHWWNPTTGEREGEHGLDGIAFERLRLSPDGKFLAVSLKAGTKYYPALWSVEKNEIVRRFKGDLAGQINDLAFSPDGKTLAVGGGHYLTNPMFQPGPIGPWVRTRRVTQAGKQVTVHESVCEIKCWDVATGDPLVELPGPKHWLEAVQFTPDGSTLITAGGVVGQSSEIRLWDTAGLRPKAVLGGHTNSITCGLFSPDGTRFATGSADSTVAIWNVVKALAGDASAKTVLKGHKGLVRSLAWSAAGDRIISSAEDGVVIVWDPTKPEPLLTITAHDRPIYGVALSPDGTLIATAAGDWKNRKKGEVRVWDAHKGTELFRLPDTEFSAWAAMFTGDSKLITAHLEEVAIRVFDLSTKKEIKTLTAPAAPRGLALSKDGKYLGITSQSNGLVKLWQTGAWRESHEVSGHPGKPVFTIEFAGDGQTVLSAGGDGAVMIWKIPGGDYKLPEFVPPAPPKAPPQTELQPLEKN
jgi:WD40 repeat protein